MFRRSKIFLFVCVCWSLLFSASDLCAQKIDFQSAEEFARTHGGSAYIDVLSANKDAEKIMCGDKNTICNAKTETCLKCTSELYVHGWNLLGQIATTINVIGDKRSMITDFGGVTRKAETGKCVSTSTVINNKDNLKRAWPDDNTCVSKTTRFHSFVIYPGTVSIARTGFISVTNYKTLLIDYKKTSEEFVDSKGKSYKLVINEDNAISIAYKGEYFDGCEVLPVKIYNMQKCFFCPLAAVIFSSANDITSYSFLTFSSSFGKLIVVIFAIWLALATLNQVASMTKQDAPKFIATVLKQGFKIAFAFALISNANNLFSYFINPLLSSGMVLGNNIQTTEMEEPKNYEKSIITSSENFFNLRPADGSRTLYEKIEVYLASLQMRLSYMQALGTSLFCVGSHTLSLKGLFKDSDDGLSEFKDGLRMMFLGGIMTVFAFLLTIAFGFYFLDALLQLAIVGAMLPLMIAGWPFKATSQYASTGFKIILNTFFVMFFIGFVVSVNVELVDQSLTLGAAMHNETDISDKNAVKGLEALALAMSEQKIEQIDEATSIGAAGFLILAFAFLFGFKFVAKASELAGTMAAGGLKGGISSSIGTMGASLAKGAASKISQPVRKVASDQFHKAGGVVGSISGAISKGAGKLGKGDGKIAKAFSGISKFAGKAQNIAQKAHGIYIDPKNK